jgi:hypothetical protein
LLPDSKLDETKVSKNKEGEKKGKKAKQLTNTQKDRIAIREAN